MGCSNLLTPRDTAEIDRLRAGDSFSGRINFSRDLAIGTGNLLGPTTYPRAPPIPPMSTSPHLAHPARPARSPLPAPRSPSRSR